MLGGSLMYCAPLLSASCYGQKLLQGSITYTAAGFSVCVCLNASQASLHVCQRVKPYQTSHHYKLIPQPQEGLHNGQCTVGVTQASPSTPGSGLTVSNESTQQNLSTRPGPKEMYVLTMSDVVLENNRLWLKASLLTTTTTPPIAATINSIFDLESAKLKNSFKCICGKTKRKKREKVAESMVP
ncbi:hypothetical protein PAMP_021219 [Pampus punctatissimus]